MLKKILLVAFAASAMIGMAPQAAVAGPGSCLNCEWVEHRNEFGDVVGGHWECPPDVICQDEVGP